MIDLDILAIGNIIEDINIIDGKKYESLGGSSYYAYKVSQKLGFNVRVISEVSKSLDLSIKLDTRKIYPQKAKTHTIFQNLYSNGKRNQLVINNPGKLLLRNFNKYIDNLNPKIVFYCPIFNEFEPSFFTKFENSIKVCNLQGFVRKNLNKKIKSINELPELDFKIFDTVIMSEADSSFENALKISNFSNIVCYTMGRNGVKIICDNKVETYSSVKVKNIDETGAGDVWSTSFIIFYYLMNKELYISAKLANISAALSVTGFSDDKISNYSEIINFKNGKTYKT